LLFVGPQVCKGVTKFNSVARTVLKSYPERKALAFVFGKLGNLIEGEDCWLDLGYISLAQGNYQAAHLSFLLASCDLNELGQELAKNGQDDLAAQYLYKSKNTKLLNGFGKKRMDELGRSAGLKYFMPLLHFHLNAGEIPESILALKEMLPVAKFWNCLKALMQELPQVLHHSHFVASLFLAKMNGEMGEFMKTLPLAPALILDFHIEGYMGTVPGALHVLSTSGNKEEFKTQAGKVWNKIVPALLEKMVYRQKSLDLIVKIGAHPNSLPAINAILQKLR